MEMRDEVLSSVGAQEMDTNGYQVCDLDDVEFYWEKHQLVIDVFFRTDIDITFSPPTFDGFEMFSKAENPILIEKEQTRRTILFLYQQLQSPSDQTNPLC